MYTVEITCPLSLWEDIDSCSGSEHTVGGGGAEGGGGGEGAEREGEEEEEGEREGKWMRN